MACTARQEREMKQKYERMKYNTNLPPLEQLRAYVLSRGVNSLKSIHRVFKRIDEKGDRKLEFREFQNALRNVGIFAEPQVEKDCFQVMDRSGDGVVDIDEFIIALRPSMSKNRLSLVHQAFHKLDKDGSGVVTSDDLKGVYNPKKHKKYMSGEWTEDQVFEEFLNSFNGQDRDGEVSMDDFENYYAAVSASVDTDAYFDLMMRKAWKL